MNEQKFTLTNRKGQTIVGVFEKPEGEIKGTCICQHGWGSTRHSSTIQAVKDSFLGSGFQTFNFDTTNSFGESDGNFEDSTLGFHAEDLEDVVKWAQQQSWFKGALALTGHSKGGYAIMRYAELYPKEVSILVPIAPVISGEFSIERMKKYKPEKYEELKNKGTITETNRAGIKKNIKWSQYEERLQHNLFDAIAKITMPVLIIVGSKDTSCPVEHQEILYKHIPSKNKQLSIIKNAPHSFYEQSEQIECKEIIKKWLNKIMPIVDS